MLWSIQVTKTMRRIKHVLTERFYAWEDAVEVAKEDSEVDLSGKGPAFTPQEHLEEDMLETEEEEELAEAQEADVQEGGEQRTLSQAAQEEHKSLSDRSRIRH